VVHRLTQVHAPAVQADRSGHTVPQVPQLPWSPWVLTQRVPQRVSDPGQTHAPAAQVDPTGQTVSHPPQWLVSDWMLKQLPPQLVRPAGQSPPSPPSDTLPSSGGTSSIPASSGSTHMPDMVHERPAAQRVPVPQDCAPGQRLGTVAPHAVLANSSTGGQWGLHSQVLVAGLHMNPFSHPPAHRPPQPSLDPHGAVAVQRGMQTHIRVSGSHAAKGLEHAPRQRPPQPSSAPHIPPASQVVAHWHCPTMQRSRGERVHGGSQAQVSTQRPATQSELPVQVTPAHGLGPQVPLEQISPAAQVTPSQLERGRHAMSQV
jgi:hypothetical protein